jgi:hypothetical protein
LLYRTIQEHWSTFLDDLEAGGGELPSFVLDEFEAYLRCGIPVYGFLRVRCKDCGHSRVVAFACKARAVCPSYFGRRMNEGALNLVTHVLPDVPIRQFVLTWVADISLRLFSDRVPGGTEVATVVPIEGRLDRPEVQLWPTVLGIVRNAFVEGISAGFAHLPPGVAPEKEGVLTQAKHALQKNQGPPKAQPPKTDPGSGKK